MDKGTILYKGVPFDGETIIDGDVLQRSLIGKSIDEKVAYLQSLQGFFSAILFNEDEAILFVDHARSFPLYYSVLDGKLLIADDPVMIYEPKRDEFSVISALEFLCLGYVTGKGTLIKNIKQVEAGKCIIFRNRKIESVVHSLFQPCIKGTISPEIFHSSFLESLASSFSRLKAFSRGRELVLPLSGGYDSRLIALCLRELDFSKVITFSYGRPGNKDSEISKRVAEALGFDWFFIPYSNEMWRKVAKSESWSEFQSIAFQFSSIPHLQDFPAIEFLCKEKVIGPGAVVIPGHRPPGAKPNNLPVKGGMVSMQDLVDSIISFHFNLWTYPRGSALDSLFRLRLVEQLGGKSSIPLIEALCLRGRWFHNERSSKFIVHSVRCYEHFGLRWWLPLLDKGFLSFWEKMHLSCRQSECYFRSIGQITKDLLGDVNFGVAGWKDRMGYGLSPALRIKNSNSFIKTSLKSLMNQILRKLGQKELFERIVYEVGYIRKREYEDSNHSFFAFVDKRDFMATFTGKENINSFLALALLRGLIRPECLDEREKEYFKCIKIFKSDMLAYMTRSFQLKPS
ncbi:MAG: asparagine synthase-related protein [Methanomassiliicoccales archaeon]